MQAWQLHQQVFRTRTYYCLFTICFFREQCHKYNHSSKGLVEILRKRAHTMSFFLGRINVSSRPLMRTLKAHAKWLLLIPSLLVVVESDYVQR